MNSADSDGVCEQTGPEGEKGALLLPHQQRVITRSVAAARSGTQRIRIRQGALQASRPSPRGWPLPPAPAGTAASVAQRMAWHRRSDFQQGGQPLSSAAAGPVKAACALIAQSACRSWGKCRVEVF